MCEAVIAQLGERQTEDLEVLGSIPSPGIISIRVAMLNAFYLLYDVLCKRDFGAVGSA
jgi:hypothetical protein